MFQIWLKGRRRQWHCIGVLLEFPQGKNWLNRWTHSLSSLWHCTCFLPRLLLQAQLVFEDFLSQFCSPVAKVESGRWLWRRYVRHSKAIQLRWYGQPFAVPCVSFWRFPSWSSCVLPVSFKFLIISRPYQRNLNVFKRNLKLALRHFFQMCDSTTSFYIMVTKYYHLIICAFVRLVVSKGFCLDFKQHSLQAFR